MTTTHLLLFGLLFLVIIGRMGIGTGGEEFSISNDGFIVGREGFIVGRDGFLAGSFGTTTTSTWLEFAWGFTCPGAFVPTRRHDYRRWMVKVVVRSSEANYAGEVKR
jgi:hypothetical protein